MVGGFTFSVLYEISQFLHGRNIPFAIFAVKRLKKNNCTTKELCCKRCEINENWRETGKVRAEGGCFIPVAAPPVVWVFAKSDRKHVLLICLNIFSHLFH